MLILRTKFESFKPFDSDGECIWFSKKIEFSTLIYGRIPARIFFIEYKSDKRRTMGDPKTGRYVYMKYNMQIGMGICFCIYRDFGNKCNFRTNILKFTFCGNDFRNDFTSGRFAIVNICVEIATFNLNCDICPESIHLGGHIINERMTDR